MNKQTNKAIFGLFPMILLMCVCPVAASLDAAYETIPLLTAIVSLSAVGLLAIGVLTGTVKLFG